MDPQYSLQDVHRCGICETNIAESYCDFCQFNLCKPCIGEHISDDYDKHKIVPFQHRRSTLIYPKCETHQNNKCDLQCKGCNMFVCSSCVASEQHKGHNFLENFKVYKTKKEIIKKDLTKLENLLSHSYKEIVLDLKNQLENLDEGYEELTSEISKQGEEWHREIDVVINKMKNEIMEIKVKHKDILQKHLVEIIQTQSLIERTLTALKAVEKSTEVCTTIEFSSEIKDFSKLPQGIKVCLPKFIKTPMDREKLYSFFGEILPLSIDTQENVLFQKEQNTLIAELLDEPELVSTIDTGNNVNLLSISYLKENRIWTSGMTSDIRCLNLKGSLIQTMKTKSGNMPYDIAVHRNGDLLYCDGSAGTIYRVNNDQTERMIILQGWTPSKLCVTSSGDLLVTMFIIDQSKVVRYSGSTEKQTIQFDDKGNPFYSGNDKTKFITENRNLDICVADSVAGAVVVVNQDGKLRWRYTGHPSTANNKLFHPCGITADSQSHILTADTDKHRIHILDQNGQFLRYIVNCDLKNPYGLCVDNNDNLFVCEYYNSNVKKINYLKYKLQCATMM